jgi:hypothetical protein
VKRSLCTTRRDARQFPRVLSSRLSLSCRSLLDIYASPTILNMQSGFVSSNVKSAAGSRSSGRNFPPNRKLRRMDSAGTIISILISGPFDRSAARRFGASLSLQLASCRGRDLPVLATRDVQAVGSVPYRFRTLSVTTKIRRRRGPLHVEEERQLSQSSRRCGKAFAGHPDVRRSQTKSFRRVRTIYDEGLLAGRSTFF